MHRNIFNRLCFHLAFLAVMIYSIVGYHHHEDTHICLGWEHLMHHNQCHKGLSCLPTHSNNTESSCHCHSGRLQAIETAPKQNLVKSHIHYRQLLSFIRTAYSFFIFQDSFKHYPKGYKIRYPLCPQLQTHRLRAPPALFQKLF